MPVEAVGDELLWVCLLAAQRALGALRADDRVTRALVTCGTYKIKEISDFKILQSLGRVFTLLHGCWPGKGFIIFAMLFRIENRNSPLTIYNSLFSIESILRFEDYVIPTSSHRPAVFPSFLSLYQKLFLCINSPNLFGILKLNFGRERLNGFYASQIGTDEDCICSTKLCKAYK